MKNMKTQRNRAVGCSAWLGVFGINGTSLRGFLFPAPCLDIGAGRKTNRKPTLGLVKLGSAGDWHGRPFSVDKIRKRASGFHDDFALLQQLAEGLDGFWRDSWPQNNVWKTDLKHRVIACEARNISVKIGKGRRRPLSNVIKNSVFHNGVGVNAPNEK